MGYQFSLTVGTANRKKGGEKKGQKKEGKRIKKRMRRRGAKSPSLPALMTGSPSEGRERFNSLEKCEAPE